MRSLARGSLALLLLLAVACSGSDSKDSASDKTSTTTSTSTTIKVLDATDVDASASKYCAAWADIRKAGGPPISGDPKKDAEARKVHYTKIVPLAEKLVAAADDDIKTQAQYALDQVKEVAATGSDAPFTKAGASKVQQELAQYALDHCAKSAK